MGIFSNVLKDSESLFMDDVALDYDYMPKLMPYREQEQFKIASCIKPLFAERNGKNVFVYGKPGIGKTLAIRHILRELEEETDDIIPLYVNCWQKNTTYKVLLELCDLLGYRFTQNKKTEDLFAIVKDIVNKKSAVFVFDEVDKSEELDVLYTLSEQIYRKSIIMITNFSAWMENMDMRVRSRLTPELVEFRAYNSAETKGILQNRVKYAFQPNVWQDDAFNRVADKTSILQDIRSGLYLLRESGNAAEERSSRKIELADVDIAEKKLESFNIKKSTDLDDESQKILTLVRAEAGSGEKIGELYKKYSGDITYKTFQRKIDKLSKNKFISTEKIPGGKEGKTTIVKSSAVDKKLDDFK
ncbi:MAG: Cdc6/Cdc18 family protein [Candidatus Woesearchaeota archaeon]